MFPLRSTRLPHHEVLRAVLRSHPSRLRPSIRAARFSTSLTPPHSRQSSPSIVRSRGQVRHASTKGKEPPPKAQQTQTLGQVLRRAMKISNTFRGQSFKTLFRDSPEEMTLAMIMFVALAGCIGYTVWMYFNYFYAEQFTKFPPPIAKSLRRALYYSNYKPDPPMALKYYKMAVEQCNEHGLDPFSDEVTGIKIQLAAFLEQIGNVKAAIQVLDMVLAENKKWLNVFETTPQKLPRAPLPGTVVGEGESERTITQAEFETWLWSARTRILAKSCGMSTKLGELYADDQVLNKDKSHEYLTWTVETALKEFRRRAADGVKDGEGPWMTPEEIGGAMESLGHSYERKEQFDLALPLFFQALRLCQDQCHMAVLMNNLAVSFAQHPPKAPYETLAGIVSGEEAQKSSSSNPNQTWTRKEMLESAKRWAKNALDHAKEPQGEQRTQECDYACAAALVNLGDIAAMVRDDKEARRRYERAMKLSEEIDFADGIKRAKDGLERLSQ